MPILALPYTSTFLKPFSKVIPFRKIGLESSSGSCKAGTPPGGQNYQELGQGPLGPKVPPDSALHLNQTLTFGTKTKKVCSAISSKNGFQAILPFQPYHIKDD